MMTSLIITTAVFNAGQLSREGKKNLKSTFLQILLILFPSLMLRGIFSEFRQCNGYANSYQSLKPLGNALNRSLAVEFSAICISKK